MCEWGDEVVLDLPDDINPERSGRTVAIDSCIVETIQALWREGCQTRGCCCGHGRGAASLVVSSSYDDEGIRRIADFLKTDGRPWVIEQWRLVKVAMTLPVSHP
jgi:hypothetical protein